MPIPVRPEAPIASSFSREPPQLPSLWAEVRN